MLGATFACNILCTSYNKIFIVIIFLLKFEILIESFKNNIRYIIYNNIILGLTEI